MKGDETRNRGLCIPYKVRKFTSTIKPPTFLKRIKRLRFVARIFLLRR